MGGDAMKKTISILLILVLLLCGCKSPRKADESATADVKWDMIPAVMVNDTLYITTGYASNRTDRPDTPDGIITSEVPGSELPAENNQSNFGTGFAYNLGYIKGTVEVKIEGQWWIYAEEEVKASGLYKQPYLKFEGQNNALSAHQNMLSHFAWDMNYETVNQFMPENYGGCYINDNNVFCVCLVSSSEGDIEKFYAACGTEEIYIQPVKYTLTELMVASEAIGAYNESHDTPLCWSWGTDEMNNCVSITVAQDMAKEAEELRKQHPCIQYALDIPELSPAEHENAKSHEDITLTAEYPIYPTDVETISFYFENGSEKFISYPDEFLEIEIDGVWHAIPYRSDIAFTTELPGLFPGETRTVNQRTDIRNYDFIPGKYRFGIGYCYEEDYNGQNADYIAWAEFELQD